MGYGARCVRPQTGMKTGLSFEMLEKPQTMVADDGLALRSRVGMWSGTHFGYK